MTDRLREWPWRDARRRTRRGFWLAVLGAVLATLISNGIQASAQSLWTQQARDYWVAYGAGLVRGCR